MEFPFVGKARKVRQRIKSILKIMYHQLKIIVMKCIVLMYVSENLMEREIYATYMINEFQSKYNVNKVFYK